MLLLEQELSVEVADINSIQVDLKNHTSVIHFIRHTISKTATTSLLGLKQID